MPIVEHQSGMFPGKVYPNPLRSAKKLPFISLFYYNPASQTIVPRRPDRQSVAPAGK